jgi:hypothetical protein
MAEFALSTTIMTISQIFGEKVVLYTKALNEVVGTNAVDKFMDTAHGVGHRIEFGHSLDYIPEIYSKFGLKGVSQYFDHGFTDVMSPHGMPIPFAKEVGEQFSLSTTHQLNWLCVNIGDLLSGGIALTHSALNAKLLMSAVRTGHLAPEIALMSLIGAASKIGLAIVTPNPISLVAGFVDVAFLAWALQPAFVVGSQYFTSPYSNLSTLGLSSMWGALTGAVVGGLVSTWESRGSKDGKNFNFNFERIAKYTASGTIGGLAGSVASLASKNVSIVTSATIAGYIVGEKAFESIIARLKAHRNRPKAAARPIELLPDFLLDYDPLKI